jgi:hypothetical protein
MNPGPIHLDSSSPEPKGFSMTAQTKQQKLPEICMIISMTESGLIGKGCGLPWKSSLASMWFHKQTMGYPVIVGRKTAQGMPEFPLKNSPCGILSFNRTEAIVVGSNGYAPIFRNPDTAVLYYRHFDKIFFAGGANVFSDIFQATKPGDQNTPFVDTIIRTVLTSMSTVEGEDVDSKDFVYFKDFEKDNPKAFKDGFYKGYGDNCNPTGFNLARNDNYELSTDKMRNRIYVHGDNGVYESERPGENTSRGMLDSEFLVPDRKYVLEEDDTGFFKIKFAVWKRKKENPGR